MDPRTTLDAERYHCNVRVRFKEHRPRSKRKDAMSIARAQVAMTAKLEAEVERAGFKAIEREAFRGLAGRAE